MCLSHLGQTGDRWGSDNCIHSRTKSCYTTVSSSSESLWNLRGTGTSGLWVLTALLSSHHHLQNTAPWPCDVHVQLLQWDLLCVCYLTSTRDHEVTTGQQLSSEAAAVTGVLQEIHIQQSHLHSTGVHTGHTWCQHAQLHADRTFPYVLTGNCKLQKWQPESDKLFREVLNSLWIFIIYDWALIQVGLGNADFGHTTGKKQFLGQIL